MGLGRRQCSNGKRTTIRGGRQEAGGGRWQGGRREGGAARTCEAGLVQGGDCAEDLLHAWAEAAYTRDAVFLRMPNKSAWHGSDCRRNNARTKPAWRAGRRPKAQEGRGTLDCLVKRTYSQAMLHTRIGLVCEAEAVLADVSVGEGDDIIHAMAGELLPAGPSHNRRTTARRDRDELISSLLSAQSTP